MLIRLHDRRLYRMRSSIRSGRINGFFYSSLGEIFERKIPGRPAALIMNPSMPCNAVAILAMALGFTSGLLS